MQTAVDEKRTIRRWVRERLAEIEALPASRRGELSELVCRQVGESSFFSRARSLMVYIAKGGEVDMTPLMELAFDRGLRVCVPAVDWEAGTMSPVEVREVGFARRSGRLGVAEPVAGEPFDASALDLVVLPGLAFDNRGGRLGRGAGFYDRFMAGQWAGKGPVNRGDRLAGGRPMACGVCFADQMIPRVPIEEHDVMMDAVASDAGLIMCSSDAAL